MAVFAFWRGYLLGKQFERIDENAGRLTTNPAGLLTGNCCGGPQEELKAVPRPGDKIKVRMDECWRPNNQGWVKKVPCEADK